MKNTVEKKADPSEKVNSVATLKDEIKKIELVLESKTERLKVLKNIFLKRELNSDNFETSKREYFLKKAIRDKLKSENGRNILSHSLETHNNLFFNQIDVKTFFKNKNNGLSVNMDFDMGFHSELLSKDALKKLGYDAKEAAQFLEQDSVEKEIDEISTSPADGLGFGVLYENFGENQKTKDNFEFQGKKLNQIKLLELEINKDKKSIERLREDILQKNFKKFLKFHVLADGEKLYTNKELLSKNPIKIGKYSNLKPSARLFQFFLRNGRKKTFENAEKLGSKYHETIITESSVLGSIFNEAGIDIIGEKISWIETPEGETGSVNRFKKYFGGKDEEFLSVETYNENKKVTPFGTEANAMRVGYPYSRKKEWNGTVNNEMLHELINKKYSQLFSSKNWKNKDSLPSGFPNLTSEIPNLYFKNISQVEEFLSDVMHWNTEGAYYYRFFNTLYYIRSKTRGTRKDGKGQYFYSYQVQRYAMEKTLKDKGLKNYKDIVKNILKESEKSYPVKDPRFYKRPEFDLAKKYFDEKDFKNIAKIYRRIGIQVLRKIKSYFDDLKDK